MLTKTQYAADHLIFFDHGTSVSRQHWLAFLQLKLCSSYLVTDTLRIPPNARIVGEVWSVIMGAGRAFEDQDEPTVVVQVGEEGSEGLVEITDMLFATRGPS